MKNEARVPSAGCRGKPRIGVLGPHDCSPDEAAIGREVGGEIARRGGILLCGGLGGMMEAAAEGAKSAGGLTVGILPGEDAADAHESIDLPLPTGLGAFRNMVLVRACDAVIAIRGGYGTLSEIAFALRLGIPVIGILTWEISPPATLRVAMRAGNDGKTDAGIRMAETASDAVRMAFDSIRR